MMRLLSHSRLDCCSLSCAVSGHLADYQLIAHVVPDRHDSH